MEITNIGMARAGDGVRPRNFDGMGGHDTHESSLPSPFQTTVDDVSKFHHRKPILNSHHEKGIKRDGSHDNFHRQKLATSQSYDGQQTHNSLLGSTVSLPRHAVNEKYSVSHDEIAFKKEYHTTKLGKEPNATWKVSPPLKDRSLQYGSSENSVRRTLKQETSRKDNQQEESQQFQKAIPSLGLLYNRDSNHYLLRKNKGPFPTDNDGVQRGDKIIGCDKSLDLDTNALDINTNTNDVANRIGDATIEPETRSKYEIDDRSNVIIPAQRNGQSWGISGPTFKEVNVTKYSEQSRNDSGQVFNDIPVVHNTNLDLNIEQMNGASRQPATGIQHKSHHSDEIQNILSSSETHNTPEVEKSSQFKASHQNGSRVPYLESPTEIPLTSNAFFLTDKYIEKKQLAQNSAPNVGNNFGIQQPIEVDQVSKKSGQIPKHGIGVWRDETDVVENEKYFATEFKDRISSDRHSLLKNFRGLSEAAIVDEDDSIIESARAETVSYNNHDAKPPVLIQTHQSMNTVNKDCQGTTLVSGGHRMSTQQQMSSDSMLDRRADHKYPNIIESQNIDDLNINQKNNTYDSEISGKPRPLQKESQNAPIDSKIIAEMRSFGSTEGFRSRKSGSRHKSSKVSSTRGTSRHLGVSSNHELSRNRIASTEKQLKESEDRKGLDLMNRRNSNPVQIKHRSVQTYRRQTIPDSQSTMAPKGVLYHLPPDLGSRDNYAMTSSNNVRPIESELQGNHEVSEVSMLPRPTRDTVSSRCDPVLNGDDASRISSNSTPHFHNRSDSEAKRSNLIHSQNNNSRRKGVSVVRRRSTISHVSTSQTEPLVTPSTSQRSYSLPTTKDSNACNPMRQDHISLDPLSHCSYSATNQLPHGYLQDSRIKATMSFLSPSQESDEISERSTKQRSGYLSSGLCAVHDNNMHDCDTTDSSRQRTVSSFSSRRDYQEDAASYKFNEFDQLSTSLPSSQSSGHENNPSDDDSAHHIESTASCFFAHNLQGVSHEFSNLNQSRPLPSRQDAPDEISSYHDKSTYYEKGSLSSGLLSNRGCQDADSRISYTDPNLPPRQGLEKHHQPSNSDDCNTLLQRVNSDISDDITECTFLHGHSISNKSKVSVKATKSNLKNNDSTRDYTNCNREQHKFVPTPSRKSLVKITVSMESWLEHCREPIAIDKIVKKRQSKRPQSRKLDYVRYNTSLNKTIELERKQSTIEASAVQNSKSLRANAIEKGDEYASSMSKTSRLILSMKDEYWRQHTRIYGKPLYSKKDVKFDLTTSHANLPKGILRIVSLLPGNDRCCDCATPFKNAATLWASVSYGTLLCEQCAFNHINHSEKVCFSIAWTFHLVKNKQLLTFYLYH